MIITDVHVNIGELRVGNLNERLKANLGSCVGVAFIWKEKKICGLAHGFLPKAPPGDSRTGTARYLDLAITSLRQIMQIGSFDASEITVILAGGGEMFSDTMKSALISVGQMNIAAARAALLKEGFVIYHEQTGGHVGRQIVIDCGTLDFEIIDLPRLGQSEAM